MFFKFDQIKQGIEVRTPRRIHGIKNHSIWIKICGEIKEQKLDRKSIMRIEKTENLSKVQLIYESNLKDDHKRQKIRRKTHNPTHSRA